MKNLDLARVAWVLGIMGLSALAMHMTGNVKWIWFALFSLFVL